PSRGQPVSLRTEGDAAYPAAVSAEIQKLPAGRNFPNTYGPVGTARYKALTVGGERHARHPERVPPEGEDLIAACRVPDPHFARPGWGHDVQVPRGRGEVLAVWAEGHTVGPVR